MELKSDAFENGGFIPEKYTCDGDGVSPPLRWSDLPSGTVSLALVMDDPDVPEQVRPDGHFTHWLVYDIDPAGDGLPEAANPPKQGLNDAGQTGYVGSCPPTQYPPTEHRYFFRLYALSERPSLPVGLTQAELEEAIKDFVLAEAVLMGRYDRAKS
ncbi:MAG TPA: YbhB/YbcL family Raf kinase inhibitor-like protein [Candidatus Moranbacteria bacterium]|nr:YbhB/YbcL family Raf kinase inhibitor-like protein [Candidatus Moranbacteria bacterium]